MALHIRRARSVNNWVYLDLVGVDSNDVVATYVVDMETVIQAQYPADILVGKINDALAQEEPDVVD